MQRISRNIMKRTLLFNIHEVTTHVHFNKSIHTLKPYRDLYLLHFLCTSFSMKCGHCGSLKSTGYFKSHKIEDVHGIDDHMILKIRDIYSLPKKTQAYIRYKISYKLQRLPKPHFNRTFFRNFRVQINISYL